jgi:hypothetical protein
MAMLPRPLRGQGWRKGGNHPVNREFLQSKKNYNSGVTGFSLKKWQAFSCTAREEFKRFNVPLKNIGCMILPKTRAIAVLACMLLLVIPSFATAVADSSPAVPLIGMVLPELGQEKSKLVYTADDFENDGDKALKGGYYDDAVKYYDKAEEMRVASDPSRTSHTEFMLMDLENKKGIVYQNWGSHDAEMYKAFNKAESLKSIAAKKQDEELGNKRNCLIVTATFGSPLASEVELVRGFRDDSIVQSYTGSRFMPGFNAWYYSFSPQVSMYINEHPQIKPFMQAFVTPTLRIVLLAQACYSLFSFNKEIATIVAILVGSTLYSLIYLFPAAIAAAWVARRHGWSGRDIRSMRPAGVAWIALFLLTVAGTVFSLDLLTTIASGLFVVATIVLVAGSLTLGLSRYVGRKAGAAVQE